MGATTEQLAREAGINSELDVECVKDLGDPPFIGAPGFWGKTIFTRKPTMEDLARFAALVRADERERCANICEGRAGIRSTGAWVALTAAADAIRRSGGGG